MSRHGMAVMAVLTALVSGSCSDEPAPPRLSVRVVDSETGSPIIEARLVVESLDPEVGEVARGLTDDDGVWTVTLPEPGTYQVGNLHLIDDPPCWWDIPRTEVVVTEGTVRIEFEGFRVCR